MSQEEIMDRRRENSNALGRIESRLEKVSEAVNVLAVQSGQTSELLRVLTLQTDKSIEALEERFTRLEDEVSRLRDFRGKIVGGLIMANLFGVAALASSGAALVKVLG